MPTYTIKKTGERVELNDTYFKAKGGEGSIYIIGDTVYKVCEKDKMIPAQKFQELAVLDHPNIIVPQETLLYRNKPTGYTMRAVPGNPYPLGQILTKPFREREGVTPDDMLKLVEKIASIIKYVHSHKGYLQVDGNEFNYMVPDTFDDVFAIDTNSYQTPNFPAEVIMPSIRDLHVSQDSSGMYKFSELSDWYSFAVISFYMFTGIHPFKGRHPDYPNMKTSMHDNMLHCKPVLLPETMFPMGAVYHPFEDYIPGGKDGAYMQWYRSVFIDNKRLPAPDQWQAVLSFVAKVKEIIGSNNFEIIELKQFADQVVGFYANKGREVVVTKEKVYIGGKETKIPSHKMRIGFTPKRNIPYAAWLDDGVLKLTNLEDGSPIKVNLHGKSIMSCEGRVYVQGNNNISELAFVESGALFGAPQSVASILPNATEMFQGVVIQDMFGNYVASVFPETGHHRQIKLDEIKDYRITEAKYEHNVLMVVAFHKESGQYDRFVYRFSTDWNGHDLRKVENISPVGINFTVLENGIVISLTEEEKIEVFSSKKDRPDVKSVGDPCIESDMRLCHVESEARFARGNKIYQIKFK